MIVAKTKDGERTPRSRVVEPAGKLALLAIAACQNEMSGRLEVRVEFGFSGVGLHDVDGSAVVVAGEARDQEIVLIVAPHGVGSIAADQDVLAFAPR